jgi:hypothetical protein
MMKIKRDVIYTQAFGCRLCLHIGTIAVYCGRCGSGRGTRLEICTPRHWFRWTRLG